MNILLLNDNYSQEGGTEAYINMIFVELGRLGHQVFLVVGASDQTLTLTNSQVIPALEKSKVLAFLKEKEIDIAYFQTVEKPDLYKAVSAAVPSFRMLHDTASVCKYHFVKGEICQEKLSLGHCLNSALKEGSMSKNPLKVASLVGDRMATIKNLVGLKKLFCNSNFTMHTYEREGIPRNLMAVVPMFPTVAPTEESVKQNRKDNVILFSGRIFKEKGLEYLIRSFSKVRKGSELWIVGEGWDTERCKKITSELSLQNWVRFWGFLDKNRLAEVYSMATIGGFPSMWGEPFGLTGIEMMSFGIPVVGFNTGAVGEWLISNKSGFLVEPGDIDDMAQKMNILLEDKEKRVELGKMAADFVKANYNIDSHIDQLVGHFEQAKTKTI